MPLYLKLVSSGSVFSYIQTCIHVGQKSEQLVPGIFWQKALVSLSISRYPIEKQRRNKRICVQQVTPFPSLVLQETDPMKAQLHKGILVSSPRNVAFWGLKILIFTITGATNPFKLSNIILRDFNSLFSLFMFLWMPKSWWCKSGKFERLTTIKGKGCVN